jgi:hypothetical protein
MLTGDPDPFADIYTHSVDGPDLSAEGGLHVAWAASWKDCQVQARLALGGHMEAVESHIIISGDPAVVQSIAQGSINKAEAEAGDQVAGEPSLYQPSVYRQEDCGCKILAAHADALPNWFGVAGSACSA